MQRLIDNLSLSCQYTTIPHLAIFECPEGLVDALFGHREYPKNRLDPLHGCKFQHFSVDLSTAGNTALNADTIHQKWHIWQTQVTLGYTEWVDDASWVHDVEVHRPIDLDRACYEQSIDTFAALELELFQSFRGIELVSAKLGGFILLRVRAGKDNDLATHLSGELDCKMSETTNTENADTVTRSHWILLKSCIYCDTCSRL